MNTPLKSLSLTAALSCGFALNSQATVSLDFASSTATNTLVSGSNAGNITFAGITNTLAGTSVDLVATVSGGLYEATNTANNGVIGGFGSVNAIAGSNFSLLFSFVDSNTGAAVILPSFDLTLFDLDAGNNGADESVTFLGAGVGSASFTTTNTTTVAVAGSTFIPQTGLGVPNPTFGTALTAAQEDATVLLSFANTDSFELDFGVALPGGGRNFLFGGDTEFVQETTTTAIPEPSSIALLGLGGLALLARRRR